MDGIGVMQGPAQRKQGLGICTRVRSYLDALSLGNYVAWLNRSPIFLEKEKMSETWTKPANLYFPIDARPAEAIQPHSEQTGRPPNWHGVMRVVRSAEMQVVVCAKMHCWGDVGGCKYPSRTRSGMCIFCKRSAQTRKFANHIESILQSQPFLGLLPLLRRKETEPDFPNLATI